MSKCLVLNEEFLSLQLSLLQYDDNTVTVFMCVLLAGLATRMSECPYAAMYETMSSLEDRRKL